MDLTGFLALHYHSTTYEITIPSTYAELVRHCTSTIPFSSTERMLFESITSNGETVQIASDEDYQLYVTTSFNNSKSKHPELLMKAYDDLDSVDPKVDRTIQNYMQMKRKDKALSALRRMTRLSRHLVRLIKEKQKCLQKEAFIAIRHSKGSLRYCFFQKNPSLFWSKEQLQHFKALKCLFESALCNKKVILDWIHSASFKAFCDQRIKEIISFSKEYHKHLFNNNQCNNKEGKPLMKKRKKSLPSDFFNLSPIASTKALSQCLHLPDLQLEDDLEGDQSQMFQCTSSTLSYSIPLGKVTHFLVPLCIKNTSSSLWPKHSVKIVCDTTQSSLFPNDASCPVDIQQGQEALFAIHFYNIDLLSTGPYLAVMNLVLHSLPLGKPLLIELTVYHSNDILMDEPASKKQ